MRFTQLPELQRPLLEKFYRAHRSSMRAKGDAQIWVARDSEIVAALSLRAVQDGQWLTGLFVAPEQRGQGIASRLVEAAIAGGDRRVWLFCEPGLAGFYQRLGFVETEVLPRELVDRLARYRQTKSLIAFLYSDRC